jgi:hypothetical protein
MEEIFLELKNDNRIAAKGWCVETLGNMIFVQGPKRNQGNADTLIVISKTMFSNFVVERAGNGTNLNSQFIIDIISKVVPSDRILSSHAKIAS